MKSFTFYTLFCLLPLFSFGQWSQLGTNIQGENGADNFGSSLGINGDGTIIVSSSPKNGNNGNFAGHAKAYNWNGTAWVQMGNDIEGLGDLHRIKSVALDVTGNVLAVTATPFTQDTIAGYVRIFDWDGTAWLLRGNAITGIVGESFGFGMSLSDDGNVVAIGSPDFTGVNGTFSGRTRIYEWDGTSWVQRGTGLDGEDAMDFSGRDVSLNADGTIIAIGAEGNDAVANQSGHVRVYEWNGTTWSQQGADLDGTGNIVRFGSAVSLSDNGTRLAVGSPKVDINGIVDAGEVTVFDWDGTAWQQIGQAINGIADLDNLGEAVSLSANGNTLAVGAHEYPGKTGSVRLYELISNQWQQLGSDLLGINDGEQFGDEVALSADGSYLATSATYNVFPTTPEPGYVRVYKSATAGIEETNLIQTKIYPNPVTSSLNLNSPIDMDQIQVLDMTGRILAEYKNCGSQFELNMDALAPAAYFVNITAREEIQKLKIVKK